MPKKINIGIFKAEIDIEDFIVVRKFIWVAQKSGNNVYARASGGGIYMHRLIMNPLKNECIDHIDFNGLNNKKENLRICTRQENCQYSRPSKKTSNYSGVSWNRNTLKWRAVISLNGKQIHLGLFTNEIDAAFSFDAAAIKYFRKFANTNF